MPTRIGQTSWDAQGSRCRLPWFALTLGLALAGCGKSDGLQKLTVYPVEGRIMMADGKPLKRRPYLLRAQGWERDGGRGGRRRRQVHAVPTGGSGPSAPQGDYKVRIEPADASLLASKKSPSPGKKLPFPQKFLDEDSSGLTAVVKTEPNKLAPFRLK